MKTIIKTTFLLLALFLPATALAHDFEVDGIYYNINDNEATVTYRGESYDQYNEYTGNVTIPSSVSYNGQTYPVTSIYWCAFSNCYSLNNVTIPNTIVSIGAYAFRQCYQLRNITIPNSITSIGDYALGECNGLTSITVESGNPKYDSRNNCNAIIETATNRLIAGCKNTEIPNSVKIITSDAFQGCHSLTSIYIPSSVIEIGNYAFAYCIGLESINVDSNNPKYDSRNYCNAIIETATNKLIAGCKNTVIPNTVSYIVSGAFYMCFGLTDIAIPNSVTTIDNSAFSYCI